jgi:hypothetical protein
MPVHGACLPQQLHVAVGPRQQLRHSGPSAVRLTTVRGRPQRAHTCCLAGSRPAQTEQQGRPAASRMVTARVAPQPEHGSARARA